MQRCELAVLEVCYVGRHSVEPEIFEIEVRVEPTPGAPADLITLKFRPPQAAFLAQMLQANIPAGRADTRLLQQVAAHNT